MCRLIGCQVWVGVLLCKVGECGDDVQFFRVELSVVQESVEVMRRVPHIPVQSSVQTDEHGVDDGRTETGCS